MGWNVPGVWSFALLSLAAYRVYRIGARDTITEPIRARLSYPDDEALALGDDVEPRLEVVGVDQERPKTWRVYLATLIRCPWCAGFYVSLAAWLLWMEWPRPTLCVAAPLAVSCVVGLVKKTLDA